MFLSQDDVEVLTGFRSSRRQIETLRKMGILFHVNGRQKPVVPVAAITGAKPAQAEHGKWNPLVLK
jgi:hypothetical protein